jgi:hypothetical protein
MSQTSYVAYGVENDGKLDLYSIDPDRRDVVPPNGSSVYWKVFATKVATSDSRYRHDHHAIDRNTGFEDL